MRFLNSVGKMFRCTDLPWVIQFFIMFFNDKPVDWLLDGLIQTRVCNLEKDNVSDFLHIYAVFSLN